MADKKDPRKAAGEPAVPETPGVPQAYGKGAAPEGEEPSREEKHEGLPEHRNMAQRRDLGEGDIEASEYEDRMSHEPSRE